MSGVNMEVMKSIEWIPQLMDTPSWPKLRDHLTVELQGLKDAGMILDPENLTKAQRRALNLTGQAPPTNDTERVRVYSCFQAVVTYMETKLKELEYNNKQYNHGVQQLREEEGLPTSEPQTTLTSK